MTTATTLELVSGVAHDLQAPIAAVRAAAAALRANDPPLDEETRERLLGVIAAAGDQLAGLVDDLLLAGRLGAGRLPVRVDRCDAFPIADAVVQAARAGLPKGLSLRFAAVAGLPDVAADPDRLRQVLQNLVSNAIRHSGGRGTVEVRLEAAGNRLRLAVSDEGPGVPPAERERIFDRYHRGASDAPGTGLGLYLARELVTAMGGTLSVESEPGPGATFAIALPLA